MSPKAFPLHLPTADELRHAHKIFRDREPRDYAYRAARMMLTDASTEFEPAEAIDLLLRSWNSRSRYTHSLTLDITRGTLGRTASIRGMFEERPIETLSAEDSPLVVALFTDFRQVFGQVGAAKALGLLLPRFFPLWDTEIARSYCGWSWDGPDCANHYFAFMEMCAEQCTTKVSEAEFGDTLLKTLDEWNYAIWTHGWLADPRKSGSPERDSNS